MPTATHCRATRGAKASASGDRGSPRRSWRRVLPVRGRASTPSEGRCEDMLPRCRRMGRVLVRGVKLLRDSCAVLEHVPPEQPKGDRCSSPQAVLAPQSVQHISCAQEKLCLRAFMHHAYAHELFVRAAARPRRPPAPRGRAARPPTSHLHQPGRSDRGLRACVRACGIGMCHRHLP